MCAQRVNLSARTRRRRLAALLGLALLSSADLGCTRKFWRRQADREVDGILTSKNCYDAWRIEQYHLMPDARARFADPNSIDRPPMPPDDPGAKCLSPNPQKPGKAGIGNPVGYGYLELIANWDAENRAARPQDEKTLSPASIVGPPSPFSKPYTQGLQSNERPFIINLDQACELGLFNSREFQDQRENLYLAALPVTLQRFAFACQFFATEELIREYTGARTPEGLGNRWRANSQLGFSRLFPTGALLLVRFANQVVVNMAAAGSPRVITPSVISLDFTQPLLQDGGKAVTLEPLTQTERNLLYQVRGYARFRKQFYVAVAGGGDYDSNLTPPPLLSVTGSVATEGYMPTLLRAAFLENEKQNVEVLERILNLYRNYEEGGDVSQLQVDQVELDLLTGRSTVLQRMQELRDALDRFKLQLGVPPQLPIELDDGEFRPLYQQQQRFLEVVTQFENIRGLANRTDWPAEPEKLRERLKSIVRDAPVVEGTKFRTEFLGRWLAVEALNDQQIDDRRKKIKAELKELKDQTADAEATGRVPPPQVTARIRVLERDSDVLELERTLRNFLSKPWDRPGADPERQASARASAYRDTISDFVVVVSEARDARLQLVREQWPGLPAVKLGDVDLVNSDLDQATAMASRAALDNRLDLMNARAQLVDAWRKIAVTANALMGVLDIRYHLDSANFPGTQPFDFDPGRTRHQMAINGELPLVRQAERNDYRAALINFQRNRRILQREEDSVLVQVRTELRQLRFLAENYRIQQRQVELAFYQVENSLNTLQAPPRVVPAGQQSSSQSDSGSQAALTRQLLDAVRSLVRAQNQLYLVYQSYVVTRMQLFRDLELLPLDDRGVWIDERSRDNRTGNPAVRPAIDIGPLTAPRVLPEPIAPPNR